MGITGSIPKLRTISIILGALYMAVAAIEALGIGAAATVRHCPDFSPTSFVTNLSISNVYLWFEHTPIYPPFQH
jgi:hypothetical protein